MIILLVLLVLAGTCQRAVAATDDAAALKSEGVALAAQRKLDQALPAFAQACALAPQDEDTCYYLARTLYLLDRWDEASEPFEKALRAAAPQKTARVHRAMALNFIALGRAKDAERHLREAVLLNDRRRELPDDPRVDLGSFLFREGRMDEAVPILKEAALKAPQSAHAHAEFGRVLLHTGSVEQAALELEQAVRLDPRAWNARLLYGRALLQLGRSSEGERELQIAREGWREDQGSTSVR